LKRHDHDAKPASKKGESFLKPKIVHGRGKIGMVARRRYDPGPRNEGEGSSFGKLGVYFTIFTRWSGGLKKARKGVECKKPPTMGRRLFPNRCVRRQP